MAFDGQGKFNRIHNWQNDAANDINIRADRMDEELDGIADALSITILRDGQAAMTANLDLGNQRIIRLSDPVQDTDAANKQWVDANYLTNGSGATISNPDPYLNFKETGRHCGPAELAHGYGHL